MVKMLPSYLRQLTWDEIAEEIRALDAELYETMGEIAQDKSFTLYEVRYPYGEYIVDQQGDFRLPDQNGDLHAINSGRLPSKIAEDLGYHSPAIAFGMMLEGTLQLFTEDNVPTQKEPWISSNRIFEPGDLIALNRTLDYPTIYQEISRWRMSSGVRTPYMIPGISDKIKFSRICKELGANLLPPRNQQEHWLSLCHLSNLSSFPKLWYTRVLFFGKKWLSRQDSTPVKLFRLLLYRHAFEKSSLTRNMFAFNLSWEDVVATINHKDVDRYILQMSRHIIDAALGNAIAYQIAVSNLAGPFDQWAELLRDIYGLKKYATIIMTPKLFKHVEKGTSFYASIQLPSARLVRKRRSRSSFLLKDLRAIQYVLKRIYEAHASGKLVNARSYDINQYSLDLYAADGKGQQKDFLPSSTIYDDDPRAQYWLNDTHDKIYPYNAFLRACVKITRK